MITDFLMKDNSWASVTKNAPCEICGAERWCRRNSTGASECHKLDTAAVGLWQRVGRTKAGFTVYRIPAESTPGPAPAPRPRDTARPRSWATPEAGAEVMAKGVNGKVECIWRRTDTWQRPRIRLPDGRKEYRELTLHEGRWLPKGPDKPYPLYGVDTLPATGLVYVVEGEKCVDAARGIGLPTVTSGSSTSASSADWQPLAGRDVVILPDFDKPGLEYAQAVSEALQALDPPAKVKILHLPDLPARGDVVEFIAARDSRTSEEILAEVEGLADAVALEDNTPGIASGDVLNALLASINDGRPAIPRVLTPIEVINEAGGLVAGEYLAIMGAPGVGKTMFTDRLVVDMLAANGNATAVIVSLETDPIVRMARLLSSVTVQFSESTHALIGGVPHRPMIDGELRAAGKEAARAAARRLADITPRLRYITDTADAEIIAGHIKTMQPTIAVVDHVGLLLATTDNATASTDVALAHIQAALRESRAIGVLICEVNKGGLASDQAGLGAIRGSARLASLAGMVMSIGFADDGALGDECDRDPALELAVLKARHGHSGITQDAVLFGGYGLVFTIGGSVQRRKARARGGNNAARRAEPKPTWTTEHFVREVASTQPQSTSWHVVKASLLGLSERKARALLQQAVDDRLLYRWVPRNKNKPTLYGTKPVSDNETDYVPE